MNAASAPAQSAHQRYQSSAIKDRPVYDWPNKKRLAVHFCLNVEYFHYGTGLGNDYAVAQPQPNVRSYAWKDYGNRVGAYRLLELAEQFDFNYALLVNSDLYKFYPELIANFSARGDEIVGHGRTNSERQIDMDYAQEAACIKEVVDTIRQHEGKPPTGWLAPYICQNEHTLELLKQNGFEYMMDWPLDDQPVWFDTANGKILSIPYSHDLNDSIECVSRRTPADVYCRNLIDQFDEMLEESSRRPLVMSFVLHSFILGQPYRLRQFRRVIEHVMAHRDDIWLSTPGAIARHIMSLPKGVVPGA